MCLRPPAPSLVPVSSPQAGLAPKFMSTDSVCTGLVMSSARHPSAANCTLLTIWLGSHHPFISMPAGLHLHIFSEVQDVSGGKPVPVEGTDLPLWGMEIDPEEAKEEFRASLAVDGGEGARGFMSGMGLGMVVEQ